MALNYKFQLSKFPEEEEEEEESGNEKGLLKKEESFACLETVREERVEGSDGVRLGRSVGLVVADFRKARVGLDRDLQRVAIGESFGRKRQR